MTYLQFNSNFQGHKIFVFKCKVDFFGNSEVAVFLYTLYMWRTKYYCNIWAFKVFYSKYIFKHNTKKLKKSKNEETYETKGINERKVSY